MTCPRCSGVMEVVNVGLVVVDRCTSCGGLWFDMNEDEWLKRSGSAAMVDTAAPAQSAGSQGAQSPVQCPRCHTRMMRMVDPGHPDVSYESCAICYGNFFDAGEFREVAGGGGVLGAFRRWLTGGTA